MSLRQAAQQALEALTLSIPKPRPADDDYAELGWKEHNAAITALRAALAKPEQEPVAWMWRCKPFCNWPEWSVSLKRPADSGRDGNKRTEGYEDVPLYAAPTPRKPLTDEEIVRLMVGEDRVQLLYSKPGDPYFSEFAEGAIRELVESGRAIERAHGIGAQNGS